MSKITKKQSNKNDELNEISSDKDHKRFHELQDKLASFSKKDEKKFNNKGHSVASKIISELVVGFAFGGVVGYTLDYFFNTKPIFLLIFILLGIAAGFNNIYKIMKDSNTNKQN